MPETQSPKELTPLDSLKKCWPLLLTAAVADVIFLVFFRQTPSAPKQFPVADTISMVLFSLIVGLFVEVVISKIALRVSLRSRLLGLTVNTLTGGLNGLWEGQVIAAWVVPQFFALVGAVGLSSHQLTRFMTLGGWVAGFIAFVTFQLPLYAFILRCIEPDGRKRLKALGSMTALIPLLAFVYPWFKGVSQLVIGR